MILSNSLKISHRIVRRQFKAYAGLLGKDKCAEEKTAKEVLKTKAKAETSQVKKDDKSDKSSKTIKSEKDKHVSQKDAEKASNKELKDVKMAENDFKKASKKKDKELKKADNELKKDTKKIYDQEKRSNKAAETAAKPLDKDKKKIDKTVKEVEKGDEKETKKEEKKGTKRMFGKESNEVKQQSSGKHDKQSRKQNDTKKTDDHQKSTDVEQPDEDEEPLCSKFDGKLIATCRTAKFKKEQSIFPELENPPKIAILGAGLAGLTAAWRLQQVGLSNFKIYEANKRVGGRIYSAWSGEGINEYGVEWIEGDNNPMIKLACQENLTLCKEKDKPDIYMNQHGQPVNKHVAEEAKYKWKKVIEDGVKTYCSEDEFAFYDYSLLDFIKKQKENMKWKSDQAKTLFESMSYGGSCRLGGPSNQLSLNDLGAKFRYESRYGVREGMMAILAPILNDLPKEAIEYGRRVQIIQWDGCPVKIIFDDCCEEIADIVIVTFSLGVLKNDMELFEPELPSDKLEAIEKTGHATVNKVFLDFAEPFWLKGEGRVFLSRNLDHNTTEWKDAIYKIREICGGNNTLEVSLCGQPAVDLEEQCEEDVAVKVTELLRQFTGVHNTPFPIAVSKSCWSKDPLFMGSVSFMGKETTKRHLRNLGLPVPLLSSVPKILFAGDYTGCGEIGTLKGARLSGFREAERIIDIICHLGWPPKQRRPCTYICPY